MEFSEKFVCEDIGYSTYEKYVSAPLFRKSFVIEKKVEQANVLICGLGFYDLFINGQKITKGYLAPYVSNSDHYTYYDKYEIKKYLIYGENVIGIMLGDGFQVGKTSTWEFKDNITNSAPLLALSVEIECNGERFCFEADEFVCKKGPVLFNDLRSGVFYDARLEEKGWNQPGFQEEGWHKPIFSVKPRGKAKICEAEPIVKTREIKPKSIRKGERDAYVCSRQVEQFLDNMHVFEEPSPLKGGYIYDFGENNSGIYRLKITGTRGQKIDIQCSEQLPEGRINYNNIAFYPDGFSQRDIYYLNGEGEEIFEPMFTFHGFRYLYVSGITEEQATEDLLTYLVMSSDLEERGDFECSDEMANTIYQMGRRSDISNFFYFPLDCPHREKNGWTGDASVSAEHMIMTIGTEKSWKEWLHNIRAAQLENGMIPGIVPTCNWGYEWGSGPAWDSVLFNLPYFAYKYRGETEIIKENAAAMLRYLEYVSRKRDSRGIVKLGLGDWVPVGKGNSEHESDTGFTDSVMVIDMCRKAVKMFDEINSPLHRTFAEKLGFEMLESVRQEYIDFDTYIVRNKCQTSQAMALFYDIFKASEKKKGFEVLMQIIKKDNYQFTSGFLGIRVLFHVLADFGQHELAYHMITKKDFPSYGYWVQKGETTFLEHFLEYGEFFRDSRNHHFLGDVVNWFMSCPGGLKVQNSKLVEVRPCFISKLDFCRVSHKLPEGEIAIFWKREETDKNRIKLNIKCKGNVKYKLNLDENYTYVETEEDAHEYLVEL